MLRLAALLTVTACSFEHGSVAPRDAGDDAPDDSSDAQSCRATAVAASGAHTCVVRADGSVRCWGKNGQGELGVAVAMSETCTVGGNDFACIKTPVGPKLPVAVTALGLGDQHSCAIGAGKTYCWGANDAGQFGNGNAGDSATPVEIATRAGATAIAGGSVHTCSLAAGTVSCSGTNDDGEVGDGTTMPRYMPVTARTGVSAFGVGFENGYAISNGLVWAWGDNDSNQVDGTAIDPRPTPTQVNNVSNATAVAGGAEHACVVLSDQSAVCWGKNNAAQLGRASATPTGAPGLVTVATSIVELTAGTDHTCVRRADSTVVCWGEGYPLAGMQVALPAPATAIASGSYHDCALLDDGSVWCWGWNAYGQYGDGTTNPASTNTPVQAKICL